MEEKNKKLKNIRHTIIVYLTIAVAVLAFTAVLYTKVLFNAYVPSESMENSLMVGDRVIGNCLAYKFGNDPERFDVVIFHAPDEPTTLYIKRIIGLPGEKITIKDGKVYANDKLLDDSFIKEEMEPASDAEFQVPEDCYFMMGDNRNMSYDSREWNNPYVPRDQIIAKAILKYWKGVSIIK